jgi:hypothetical protein
MFLPILALIVTTATAAEPAWRIDITTSGGFTGHGAGGLTVAADGKIRLQMGCELRLAPDDLKAVAALVGKAKPQDWKRSYARAENPSGCCDMIRTTVTMTRGGSQWTTTWFSDRGPLPADLDALVNAVWSSPAGIHTRYKAQCKP